MKEPAGPPGDWRDWLERLQCEPGAAEQGRLFSIADRVVDNAALRPGDSVLDLGSGIGLITFRASRAVGPGGTVVALDESAECLERLASRAADEGSGNVRTVRADIEEVPLEDSSVDAVVCRSALCHIPGLEKAVSEMDRVLRSGGRFSVFEPLAAEVSYSGEAPPGAEEFMRMLRLASELRVPRELDRETLRRAFSVAGLAAESLVVHYRLGMEGSPEDEIVDEYLHDLPGSRSLEDVLINAGEDVYRIEEAARSFAGALSSGMLRGTLPGMFVWGVRGR